MHIKTQKKAATKQHPDTGVRFPGNELLLVASVGIFAGYGQDFIHDPAAVFGIFLLI